MVNDGTQQSLCCPNSKPEDLFNFVNVDVRETYVMFVYSRQVKRGHCPLFNLLLL